MSQYPKLEKWLGWFSLWSVIILYLVVLAGALVRASGSGMGCPDWPKCFGTWIPPTSIQQIPAQYLEAFQTEGHGNLFHTWVEYVNRLVGALSGLSMLAAMVLAFCIPRQRRTGVVLGFCFVLFAFVAWLGKVVVDTSLAPQKVTLHMLAGLVLVGAAIYARVRVKQSERVEISSGLRKWLWATLALLAAQIVMGTQVRQLVDVAKDAGTCCGGRLEEQLAPWFSWHWATAVLTVVLSISLWWKLRGSSLAALRPWCCLLPLIFVLIEYAVGVILVRYQIPAWAQPTHLVIATLYLGVLLVLVFSSRPPAHQANNCATNEG